jgi:hypothetical protein
MKKSTWGAFKVQNKRSLVYAIGLVSMLIGVCIGVPYMVNFASGSVKNSQTKIYVKPSLIINPPDYFNLNICVSGIENLYGYEFNLSYNTTVLNCIGIMPLQGLGELGVTFHYNINDSLGLIWVNATYEPPASPVNATSEVELIKISFQLTMRGNSPLDLHNTRILDENGEIVPHDVEDGRVIPKVPGDVDLDGHVSLSDLVTIARAYHSKPGDPNWNPNADLNEDRKISLVDLVICALNYERY